MSNYTTIIEKIFNHIVLPPRLPGHSDKDVEVGQVNKGVIQLGVEAAETLGSLTSDDHQRAWRLVKRSLESCGSIHAGGYINRCKLMEAFKGVGDAGLMLHVAKQNAGLLILPNKSESDEHTYVVECFEAAPTSQSVLACTGALKCDYPGSAVTIPVHVFQDPSFQEAIATFLEQASEELIERFAAKAKKAATSVIEPRNTPAPHLITQMFMALLEAHGSQYASPTLQKRIRDEVCWNNAYLPWRRSPFYLVIRVCIQRILYAVCGPDEGRAHYKFFIAMMHACLLQKATGILPVESRHFIRAKLCRRLSKLEADRYIIPCAVYSRLLDMCSPRFTEIIQRATMDMELEWKGFKESTERRIPSLPLRAHQDDMRLRLPNSSNHLHNILQVPIETSPRLNAGSIAKNLPSLINTDYQRFASPYSAFHTMQNQLQTQWAVPRDKRIGCGKIAGWINSYINTASNLLDGMPEEKSVMMLDLFELWVIMDKNAVRQFPLLAEYSCGFQAALLDVLHLSLRGDLVRLQKIQQYITEREKRSWFKSHTIFSNPCPGGFSDRYVRLSADKERFEQLRQEIEEASAQARKRKEKELENVNKQYSALSERVLLPCTRKSGQVREKCSHCHAKKKRRKLAISAHEDFLPMGSSPTSLVQKRAILFELAMPVELAKYRDTTWRVLSQFGRPEHVIPRGPAVRGLLRQYGSLKSFNKHQDLNFHLGSRKKSFLVSHYKGSALPASRAQVLLPFGPDFYYYDTGSNRWADEISKSVTFAHHFAPDSCVLELLNIQKEPNFAVNADGRTSYEIVTRQNEHPVTINMHEYTSSHSLLNGKATRWLSLLRELGSSNLNFSLEATMHLVNYLALQVGPGPSGSPLRLVHRVFEDPEFCHQLATQAENILDRIRKNWRESFCMEFLLTLILRILNLGRQSAQTEGLRLLHRARYITFEWAVKIHQEIQKGATTETADRLSIYGLLAGLLCKRTFAIFQDGNIDSKDMQVFLAACLLVQENLQDPAKLSGTIRAMLVRDLRAFSMDSFLGKSIMLYTKSFGPAIEAVWPNVGHAERSYSPWMAVRGLNGWTESVISSTDFFRAQIIHYHPIYGHLLVDGRPIGKLPPDYRNSPSVQEVFGHEHLLIFPSAMGGMEFTLAAPRNGHSIHFGRSKNETIVRAHVKGNLLQLVPRGIFGVGGQADLPAPLITDCFHWLNLAKKQIEIRRRKHMWWFNRPGNWMIDLATRQASYSTFNLVDPYGNLFHQIAGIFDKFEERQNITVLQPSSRNLLLEMKRMDLTFSVNSKGSLVCRQLHAEIDPDQNAGTWYGLQSKLVLRESSNRMKRSIVVPIGSLRYHRHGPHVLVEVNNDGRYGQFFIDSTLGRLKCEPEPALVYTKSLLHAYTSFPLPDPLTGRTGTEEALSHLTSALSSPWNPGGVSYPEPLIALAQLTPKRFYYPEYLKRQQQTFWNDGLTVTIQHDLYRPIIDAMATKIGRLEMFAQDKCHQIELEAGGVPYLRNRNYFRRRNFERSEVHIGEIGQPKDSSYYGLHICEANAGRKNVYEVVHILTCRPSSIQTPSLAAVFNGATHTTGRTGCFNKDSLNETLEVDIIQEWGPLTELCRQFSGDQYGIIFKLATIAFGSEVNMGLLRALAAICIYDNLRAIRIPPHAAYINFQLNERPSLDHIKDLTQSSSEVSRFSLEQAIEENGLPPSTTLREFDLFFEDETFRFAAGILHQWPRKHIICPSFRMATFQTPVVPKSIVEYWMRILRNSEFGTYLSDMQRILDTHQTDSKISVPECIGASKQYPILLRAATVPTMASLLLKAGPGKRQRMRNAAHGHLWRNKSDWDATLSTFDSSEHHSGAKISHEIHTLKALVENMMTSTTSKQRQEYAHNLKDSLDFLESQEACRDLNQEPVGLRDLERMVPIAQHSVQQQFLALVDSLTESDMRYKWLSAGQLWPCLTAITILQHLRSSGQQHYGVGMKNALLDYGVSIAQLQQLLRICDAVKKRDIQRSRDEYDNIGHENWKPKEFPDWLLMEIDSNILIRKAQVDVALATISPASGSNSVLQMNMGQGKTSVVMPMALCVLANGRTLGRLMVPKSLLLQTAQTIQSRLGDLVGREVLHIPFSRKSPVEPAAIQEYKALHEDTLNRSGIILTLPEHVLSFKLSGFQCLSDSKLDSAGAILSTNSWLTRVCRDVIDECDFSLAVKTQLIYPSGSQLSLDGHPHRWRTAHTLLGLVDEHLADLENDFAGSLEVVRRPNGGFPFVYILRPDVEEALHTRLIDDLCSGKTRILPVIRKHDQKAVKEFIRNGNVQDSVCQAALQAFHGDPIALKNLYLLRGLIVHKILLLCLKKRWNVQYGLHRTRSPIAVPFHAKGVPSEQAEWGHPDVAIVLTYLTFYYDGLSIDQLGQCLQSVSQSDDPSGEYDRWGAHVPGLPESLRHWNLISIDDDMQVREVWSYLRYTVSVVNYFLDHCVFPVHAKQFSQRLQLSGWDIPSFSTKETSSSMLTTGFSGTNDDRFLLPLTIQQNDLPALAHTNAEVLSYLLHPRNRSYVVASQQDGKRLTEEQFMRQLCSMGIRILIDAGAYILEYGNQGLARKWLEIDYKAPAAVYFDSGNKPWVIDRNHKEVPLLASSFANNLDQCLVFLDEAHTRGTDLKFPPSARGALTLSLGQTKDHTVQAAMRLRQLGTSQSVAFVGTPEVHQSILDFRQKAPRDAIDSADVIAWLLEQTCCHHEQLKSLYLAQGYDFCRRTDAAFVNNKFLTKTTQREAFLNILLQKEKHSLKEIYNPRPKTDLFPSSSYVLPQIANFGANLDSQRLGLGNLPNTACSSTSAFAEVEQERECMHHVEEVREVQQPARLEHAVFPGLHAAIREFTLTGRLVGQGGYEPAFTALRRTSLVIKHHLQIEQQSSLFISKEFTRTLKLPNNRFWREDFMRPVQWLLWSPSTSTALILIPEEAECALSLIRAHPSPPTHLLVYAAPFSKSMLHFNSLDFYAYPTLPEGHEFPSILKIELGLFSGRLFFTYEEYLEVLRYLGQYDSYEGSKENNSFLAFLQEWLSVTRKGRDFTQTPMGYVCQNRRLKSDHPAFTVRAEEVDITENLSNLQLATERGDDSGGEDIYWDVDD